MRTISWPGKSCRCFSASLATGMKSISRSTPVAVWNKLKITPPEGWVRMPKVEAAAAAAAAKMPSAVTQIEAWGVREPKQWVRVYMPGTWKT